ncbi:BNR-4 repeat-containing protein [Paenibacillus sp. FSL H7-0331]|uniref:BNR-4 repeat-containing protein n=1 Tax=Paenibacillus sp. FSL H7-0331 TaxID=1920421 RepID=UPI00096FFC7B|nr:BNR-4 repeat-containing protein [Paenibacillus sp. FSL H7-0331]OMF00688.1 hypothetical protein BK127_38250 [Paenibacillus sp. FSL H7-0331]
MKWLTLGKKLVVTATLMTLLLPASIGSAAAVLTEVPYSIDSSNQAGWWTPLDTYVTGNEYAYMAYNAPGSTAGTHKINIARRDNSGSWTNIPVMNGTTAAEYSDDIGHNQPSMARDGSGRFHVFGSMHTNTWRYFRSDTVGGSPQYHSPDMPDSTLKVTYPVLTTAPNGDLYLMVRGSDDANTRRNGVLYRWNNSASTWGKVAVIASAANRSVYPDDLVFDSNGDLHILFEWSNFPSSGLRHELSYLKYSPSTGIFSKANGSAVTLPVTNATVDIIQPLTGSEIYVADSGVPDGPGVQSAKLAVDSSNSPKVAYRYRESGSSIFSVKYGYVSSGAWNVQTVYDTSQTKAAIDITWTGSDKRVYYVTDTGTDRAFMAVNTSGSTWTSTSIAPGKPIERLAVERNANGIDILYLVDIKNLKLYYGRN